MDFLLKDTRDLLDVCTVDDSDPAGTEAAHFCVAYIEAAVDYHDAVSDRKNLKRLICYPPSATRADGVTAFINWGEAHEDNKPLMGEATVIGVARALASRWPCSE